MFTPHYLQFLCVCVCLSFSYSHAHMRIWFRFFRYPNIYSCFSFEFWSQIWRIWMVKLTFWILLPSWRSSLSIPILESVNFFLILFLGILFPFFFYVFCPFGTYLVTVLLYFVLSECLFFSTRLWLIWIEHLWSRVLKFIVQICKEGLISSVRIGLNFSGFVLLGCKFACIYVCTHMHLCRIFVWT